MFLVIYLLVRKRKKEHKKSKFNFRTHKTPIIQTKNAPCGRSANRNDIAKKARLWYNLGVIKKGKQNEKIIYDIALFNRFVWL